MRFSQSCHLVVVVLSFLISNHPVIRSWQGTACPGYWKFTQRIFQGLTELALDFRLERFSLEVPQPSGYHSDSLDYHRFRSELFPLPQTVVSYT
ncbi:hypothetical protein QBC34DRAFT_97875 [Podospora aff. communis PSN243]|uniref:Secreted protein n=1 Tax=Podospora aff. communis PSN243 TaxID=3040156 RepID=A0AAV9GNU2_9PEZI|nr:hypothetical protein QBC34DRAFT_97875 [Podospora aff. communis PSN243]